MDTTAIYLITKADDLGSNDSANRAFIHAYENGILRNGVIMMTCGKARDAAEYFKNKPDFCMGLHLTMNAEWDSVRWGPVLSAECVPSLVDENGHFFKTTQRLKENNPKLSEMMAEINAQYEAALSSGLNIRFLDIHMGFTYVVDGLEEAIADFSERMGLIKVSRFASVPRIEQSGNADRVERVIAVLKNLSPGIYYFHMGHPAFNTEEMRALGLHRGTQQSISLEREEDLQVMFDERMLKFISQNNIIPVTVEQANNLFCLSN